MSGYHHPMISSHISSHVLDTSLGKPAKGMRVRLLSRNGTEWALISSHETNQDGRIDDFKPLTSAGVYRLEFETEEYYHNNNIKECFFPTVTIDFNVSMGSKYHVPLLLSPFGISSYRGS